MSEPLLFLLLFFFLFFSLSREIIPLVIPRCIPPSFRLLSLFTLCVASTGFLSKIDWSTMNDDYRNATADDLLAKERNFNDSYYYPCPMTDPSKKQLPHQLQQQQQQQQQQQLFTCALCGKKYTWMYSLRRHQLQCGDKEARNKCHFCARKFYRRDRLKEHLLAHHPDLI